LENLYPYDDAATRQFKRLRNFDLPYKTSSAILAEVFQNSLGDEREYVERVYMSEDDLRRCQDGGLEIGIHGHEHRTLSRLSEGQQRAEIKQAGDYFRATFGLTALHFSYPYGAIGTWNDTTKTVLESLGFASAVTKVRTIVKPRDLVARWEIPRYDVRDVFDAAGSLDSVQLQALFT